MPQAVLAEEIGPWQDALRVVELPPMPEPPPETLAIRVATCGMGFQDMLQIEGKYQDKAEPPFVPINYAVGTVTAVGPGVEGFSVGDRVVGNAAEDADGHMRGGLAE